MSQEGDRDLDTLRQVQSWEQWRKQAKQMVDYIADYYTTLENQATSPVQDEQSAVVSLPVKSQVEPGYLRVRLAKPRRALILDTLRANLASTGSPPQRSPRRSGIL